MLTRNNPEGSEMILRLENPAATRSPLTCVQRQDGDQWRPELRVAPLTRLFAPQNKQSLAECFRSAARGSTRRLPHAQRPTFVLASSRLHDNHTDVELAVLVPGAFLLSER